MYLFTEVPETLVEVLNMKTIVKDGKTKTQICFKVNRAEPVNLNRDYEKELVIGALNRNIDKVKIAFC